MIINNTSNDYAAYNKTVQSFQATQTTDNTTEQDEQTQDIQKAENTVKDTASFSADSIQKAKEERKKSFMTTDEYNNFKKQLESSRQQCDAMSEEAETNRKCLLIASRIMSGDKVPESDHRYLREKNSEMYFKAIMMRMEKEKPKKHKRVSNDEEESGDNLSVSDTENTLNAEDMQIMLQDAGVVQTEVSADVTE